MTELLSCLKKSNYECITLGMPFNDFQTQWSPTQPLKKDIFSIEDNAYGCRLNGAEFMFLEDVLLSVKIDTPYLFFKEPKRVFNHFTLDKMVQQCTEHGLDWKVYRLYTVKKQIVLLCNHISYEFGFVGNKFKLEQIRVMKVDAQADNRALMIHIQHENSKLSKG